MSPPFLTVMISGEEEVISKALATEIAPSRRKIGTILIECLALLEGSVFFRSRKENELSEGSVGSLKQVMIVYSSHKSGVNRLLARSTYKYSAVR